MSDRTVEVINHELEHRLDFILSVARVVGERRVLPKSASTLTRQECITYPVTSLENESGEVHRSGGDTT